MALNYAVERYRQVKVQAAVEGADPHRLVTMLFDGAREKILGAKLRIANHGSVAEKGALISGAISIVEALRASLDREHGGELAANLGALYDYMERRLLEANLHNDVAALDEVDALLHGIAQAWNEIAPRAVASQPGPCTVNHSTCV